MASRSIGSSKMTFRSGRSNFKMRKSHKLRSSSKNVEEETPELIEAYKKAANW